MSKSKSIKIGKVRVSPWKHPSYKWRVSWYSGVGDERKRKQEGFNSKEKAETFARKKNEELEEHGVGEAEITKGEKFAVYAFRKKAKELQDFGKNYTLYDIVKDWVDLQNTTNRQEKVGSLVDRYSDYLDVKPKKGGGLISEEHKQHIRYKIKTFRDEFENRYVSKMTPDIIKNWLLDLKKVDPKDRPKGRGYANTVSKRKDRGKPLDNLSKNHFRSALNGLFDFAVDENLCEFNPIKSIKKFGVEQKEIEIFTPEEAEKLIRAAEERMIPCIAISLFSGIRRSHVLRMEWEDILWDEGEHGEILIPYLVNSKNTKTREIPMMPNLRAWLEPYRGREGKIIGSKNKHVRSLNKAIDKSGIEYSKNALRHSFASYYYKLTKDKAKTREITGHAPNSTILERYYKRRIPLGDEEKYWGIYP